MTASVAAAKRRKGTKFSTEFLSETILLEWQLVHLQGMNHPVSYVVFTWYLYSIYFLLSVVMKVMETWNDVL